jgi:hypothetical protein
MTTTVLLSPNIFSVSTFIQNAHASIEERLDLDQRPPLDGDVWPGGDLSPRPSLLLQTWRYNGSHRSGRDPRLAPLTCRMYHVCQFADGSVLLPEALRGAERSVRACGVERYVFARQVSPATRFDHSHATLDLVAPLVPPGGDDPAAQLLYVSQIVFGQYIAQEEWSSGTVDYRRYNGSGSLVDTDGVVDEHVAKTLTPLLYARADSFFIDGGDEDGSAGQGRWESAVMDKLKTSMDGFEVHSIEDAFPGHLGGQGDPTSTKVPHAVCYHSIMSTGEKGDELPPRMMGPANTFFMRNGIERHARWLEKSAASSRTSDAAGKANTSSDPAGGASAGALRADDGYLNVLFIRSALSTADMDAIENGLRARLREASEGARVVLHLAAVHFNATADVSLLCSEFQRADVVVAAHSAVLNNVLYMRARALLVEVVPYSAGRDVYGQVAGTLGVSHVGFMAQADTRSFAACIGAKSTDSAKSPVRQLLHAWTQAAAKFTAGDRRSYLDLQSTRSRWRQEMPGSAKCALLQTRLKLVSTEAVLRAIFDRAVVPRL